MPAPTCWNCGYDLAGIRVDGACPECGTPVWSRPEPLASDSTGQIALVLGIVSLCVFAGSFLTCACFSPAAGIIAVPGVIMARRALEDVRTGRVRPEAASAARAGLICNWIAIGLSAALLLVYAALIGISLLP